MNRHVNRVKIGGKYNKLTVLGIANGPNTHGKALAICRCDCGRITKQISAEIKSGQVIACGCERGKNALPTGEAAFRYLYTQYFWSAKKKGYCFRLSRKAFRKLTSSSCYYCGIQPSKTISRKLNGPYVYNGVDRMNNARGYTPSNCVPCCYKCNMLKGVRGESEFLSHIKKINENRGKDDLVRR